MDQKGQYCTNCIKTFMSPEMVSRFVFWTDRPLAHRKCGSGPHKSMGCRSKFRSDHIAVLKSVPSAQQKHMHQNQHKAYGPGSVDYQDQLELHRPGVRFAKLELSGR